MPDDDKRWQIELTSGARPPSEETIRDARSLASDGDAVPPVPGARLRLGPYAITREIGRGGQGIVYVAEDLRLGRPVALKVLSGMFGADAWARLRFEREAAATARLDHPGICTVYEAGTIDQTPFIAMRLVAGEPFGQRSKVTRVEPASRATTATGRQRRDALFADIEIIEKAARALHTAHEAGLVHRDIKPANVMVEPSGQPVILDFGLARDAQSKDLLVTGTGAFLGTPPYMSPEQIEGGAAIDRRTDVWSLGVMLYEAATGKRPFDAPTIEGLLRAIRTGEPADPRALNPAVTPELAAVILTALEKDRAHRYQTALALAEDLGRARRLEHVHARAPSAALRLWRFAQRNPAIAASIAIVIVGLSLALAISLKALRDVKTERDRAEDLLSFMLVDMKEQLEALGRLNMLAKVARKANDYFVARPIDLGKATESLQRAVALRNVGDILRAEGDIAAAVAQYQESVLIQEEMMRRAPDDPAPLRGLASSVHALAVAAMARGDRAEALAKAERSVALRKQLVLLTPGDCDANVLLSSGLVTYANALKFAERPKDALPIYGEALERWESACEADSRPARRRELGVAFQNFAEARRATGDRPGALELRRRALGVFEQLAAEEPRNLEWSELVATTLHGMAIVHGDMKQYTDAAAHYERAVVIFRRLLAEDAVNTKRPFQLATALHGLCLAETALHHPANALAAMRESVAVRARLAALDPRNRSWSEDYADARRALGVCLASMGRTDEATTETQAAVLQFEALAAAHPDSLHTRGRLGATLARAGALAFESGNLAEAIARHAAAIAATRLAASGDAPPARAVEDLATRIEVAADCARVGREHERAAGLFAESIVEWRRYLLRCADAQKPEGEQRLAKALTALGESRLDAGALGDAVPPLLEAIAITGRATGDADAVLNGTSAHVAVAEALAGRGDFDAAEQHASLGLDALEEVPVAARSTGLSLRTRSRIDAVQRLRALAAGTPPAAPADHEALAGHLVLIGKPADALSHFEEGFSVASDSESARLAALERATRAIVLVMRDAPPAGRPRLERLCGDWIAAQAGILGDRARALEERFADQAANDRVADAVREELGEIRCRIAALPKPPTTSR